MELSLLICTSFFVAGTVFVAIYLYRYPFIGIIENSTRNEPQKLIANIEALELEKMSPELDKAHNLLIMEEIQKKLKELERVCSSIKSAPINMPKSEDSPYVLFVHDATVTLISETPTATFMPYFSGRSLAYSCNLDRLKRMVEHPTVLTEVPFPQQRTVKQSQELFQEMLKRDSTDASQRKT